MPIANATAAVSSEQFSIATGPVSDDAEALFLLDHDTGLLQCRVLYPRMGQFLGSFQVNVAESLGTGGSGGSYLMLTGNANLPRSSNRPAAGVVVYVLDTESGNFVAYGIPFNSSFVPSGRPQQGVLVPLATGSASGVIDRDALR